MKPKLAFVLTVSLSMACVTSVGTAQAESVATWNDPCQRLLSAYKRGGGHKAFAVTVNAAGNGLSQYCGAASDVGSKAKAEAQAISSCKSKRIGKEWNSAIPQAAKCTVLRSE